MGDMKSNFTAAIQSSALQLARRWNWGLSHSADVIHSRAGRGKPLRELFHTLFNFLTLDIKVRIHRRRCERLLDGFRALLVFSAEFPRSLRGKL